MEANDDAFSLEVHEEMFNEEYSMVREDQSFEHKTDGSTMDETLKSSVSIPIREKEVSINNREEKQKEEMNDTRYKSVSPCQINGHTEHKEISKKKPNETGKVRISPIKWISHSPPHSKKISAHGRHSRSGSRHHRRNAHLKSFHHKRSHISPAAALRRPRSSSFELHKHLKHIFTRTQYFLIKSNNKENVDLAKHLGVWSTPPGNESRINQAFDISGNVILIFSIKESGQFQGFARISAKSDRTHPTINWVLPVGLSQRTLSGVFKLDWISKHSLPFGQTMHILNSYNENQPIKIGRDGQEIDSKSGESLCRLFYFDEKVDIESISKKSLLALKQRGIYNHSDETTYKSSSQDYHSKHSIPVKNNFTDKQYEERPSRYYESSYPSSHAVYYASHNDTSPYHKYDKRDEMYSKQTSSYITRSSNYDPASSGLKKSRDVASPYRRDIYDMVYSLQERGESLYNTRSTLKRSDSDYKKYGSTYEEPKRIKSQDKYYHRKLDGYQSKSKMDYRKESASHYDDRFVERYKEPLKLEKKYDRDSYVVEKYTEPLKVDKRYAERENNLDRYIDKDKHYKDLKSQKQYSKSKLIRDTDEMVIEKEDKATESRKHRKKSTKHATKRKSVSSEHEVKKKYQSATPEKKENHFDFLSMMQERSQNVFYAQQNQQYVFDPRVPPPPPFPFFTSAYQFLPQQPPPPYSTEKYKIPEKKEKRVKSSRHEK